MRGAGLLVVMVATAACEPPNRFDPVRAVDAGPLTCLVFPSELDFGEREQSLTTTLGLRVDNLNPLTAEVNFTQLDAPFFVQLLPQQGVFVPPRGLTQIPVAFTPTDARLSVTELVLTTRIPADCPPAVVHVRGLGAGALSAPTSVEVPPTAIGSTREVIVTLSNSRRQAASVNLDLRTFSSDGGSQAGSFVVPPRVEVPALSTLDVPIRFTALAPGVQRASILFQPAIGFPFTSSVVAIAGSPRAAQERTRLAIDPLAATMTEDRALLVRNVGDTVLRLTNPRVIAGAGAQAGEARARIVAASDLGPGQSAAVAIAFTPRHEGPAQWTVLVDTNDETQPTLSWDVSANITPVPVCLAPVEGAPAFATVQGPYPTTLELSFSNAFNAPCLVTALDLSTFSAWQLDLGDNDSFWVDAGSTVRRTLTITEPGATEVRWLSHGTNLRVISVTAN